jgi:hypothetical protein
MTVKRNEPENWGLILYYIIAFPFFILEFIVKYFTKDGVDIFFENYIHGNINNHLKINLVNYATKIVGWFFLLVSIWFSWVFFFSLVAIFANDKFFDVDPNFKINGHIAYIIIVIIGFLAIFLATIRNTVSNLIFSSKYQQILSGVNAEKTVKNLIEAIAPSKNGWLTYHNILLVFNKGLPTEWSREIDHLLVRGNSVYIVETKYKSGTIYVNKDFDTWRVVNNEQELKMRNALKQVIKACEIFDREFNLPNFTAIPIVVIVGNDVKMVNAPTNVVSYLDLDTVISAFELNHENKKINTSELINSLNKSIATDKQYFERHIKRAEEVKRKDGYKKIVAGAHRDY